MKLPRWRNIDGATVCGANIVGDAKGETKEDEATTVGGFDNAVIFNDKLFKIVWAWAWAWAWAIASVWVWFCMRVKLCIWVRLSIEL